MKLRKRRKWIVLIAAVVVAGTVALWLSAGEPTVNTRLSLSPKRPEIVKDRGDGKTNQPPAWVFEVLLHSDRLLETVSTNYSIEAHTPAGSTKYEAPFRDVPLWGPGGAPFQTLGSRMTFGEPFPFLVFMPIDADEFRVKIEMKEFGDTYSRLQRWVWVGSGRQLAPRLREWILSGQHKGVVRTIWSPWVVRSNNVWMEKVER